MSFVNRGRKRPTPRHWTRVRPAPGLRFVYWAERPDVCALLLGGKVVTVTTRALYHTTAWDTLLENQASELMEPGA